LLDKPHVELVLVGYLWILILRSTYVLNFCWCLASTEIIRLVCISILEHTP
jgi:hypothetical protein